MKKLCDH